MKPPPFEYVVAESVADTIAALGQGEAKIIAGGQSLVPMLNFRLLRPAVLVDINRVPGLAFIKEEPGAIRVGALARHFQLETSDVIAKAFPVLAAAMEHVAHLAIRNRGTIGGSLSHADPAAELPMMALLLDATLTIASASGERRLPAKDFFLGALSVDLGAGDLVTEIAFPKLPAHTGWGFEEVSRRHGDFALAAVAVVLAAENGKIAQARIAVTGVDETAKRADAAEAMLMGEALTPALRDAAIEAVRASVTPNTDLHASADYRRHLVGVLAGRALEAAWRRAMA